MRRALPLAVAAAALCVSQLAVTAPSTALTAAPDARVAAAPSAGLKLAAAPKKTRTKFAFNGSAYGTRVEGSALPANSNDTAYQRIGCTNIAGADLNNYEADLTIPGLGKVEGVRTRVWTEKKGNTFSSYSMHSVARLEIGSPSIGAVELIGLKSVSRAFNANGKYGTSVENEIARIVFKAAGEPVAEIPIPAPGQTITIPGLLELSLGKSNTKVTKQFARASGNVVDLKLLLTNGTRVRVSQTNASLTGGIKHGVFKGYSAGVEARGLDDNLKIGRTPLNVVPCRGVEGNVKHVANVDLGDLADVSGVAAAAKTKSSTRVATGSVEGRVAKIDLFGGRVIINGIVGVANVKRERGKITRDSKGSTVLEVIVDGEPYSFPALGKITIPGLLELEDAIEIPTKNGLKVIGLRITLLDGTGAVVDLGVAELGIRAGAKAGK